MTTLIRRAVPSGLVALLLALQLSAPSVAHADVIGTVSFFPVAGLDVQPMSAFTSAPCPSGTHLVGKVFGKGFPPAGLNVVSNSPVGIYTKGSNGGLEVPFSSTMRTFADSQGSDTKLAGTYEVVVSCKMKAGQQSLADFKGSLTFTSPTTYTSGDGKTPAAVRLLEATGDPTELAYAAPAQEVAASAPAATSASGTNGRPGSQVVLVVGVVVAVAVLSFVLGRRRAPRVTPGVSR
ncbi:MAG: hypothetical protein ABIM89_07050 [Mycobacteriales bacterium]